MEVNPIRELQGEKDRPALTVPQSSTRGQGKPHGQCRMAQGMLIGWFSKEMQVELIG